MLNKTNLLNKINKTNESDIFSDNNEYYLYLKDIYQKDALRKIFFDEETYAKFLNHSHGNSKTETINFIIKSKTLQQQFRHDRFWFKSPIEAFQQVIDIVKMGKIFIDDIKLLMPNSKFFGGFSKFMQNYITDLPVKKINKLDKLAKKEKIDKLIDEILKIWSSNQLQK